MRYECTSNHNAEWLVVGEIYNVDLTNTIGKDWLTVIHPNGRRSTVAKYRFKPLNERRDEIIENLLK